MSEQKKRVLPFLLSLIIVLFDQIVKLIIVSSIPVNTIGFHVGGGDFLRIIHVRNLAVAFSLGAGLSDVVRLLLFTVFPIIVVVLLILYMLKSDEFTSFQRWCVALITGGGIGNLIDRIFRPLGVVDFIDIKFYGLFGLERWPTFNIADSAVVVGGILLIASFLFQISQNREHE